jgi:hypothetical protein
VHEDGDTPPIACPWCHAAATEAIRQFAQGTSGTWLVAMRSGRLWGREPGLLLAPGGQIAELAGASEEALAELSSLSPAQRQLIEGRLRKAHDELSVLLTSDDNRAKAFLDTWAAKNVRPVSGDRDAEVSRLLARLLAAWRHSGIPGPALMRAAGGGLRSFVKDALDQHR